jgi:hypothetical protein
MDAEVTRIWSPGRNDPRRFVMAPPRGHQLFNAETLILARPPGRLRRACSRVLGQNQAGSGRKPCRAKRTYPILRRRRGRPPGAGAEDWPRGLVLASACMLGWSLPVLTWLALS